MLDAKGLLSKAVSVLASVALITAMAPASVAFATVVPADVNANDTGELQQSVAGSIPYTAPAKGVHDANEATTLSPQAAIPARYSSVDKGNVTPAVDQGVFGTCWSFASVAAIEASMLAHGQAKSADLSERHLAYFTYHATPDPLGNTRGDYTTAKSSTYGQAGVSDLYLGNGGNSWIAANTLATWQGAVNESAVGTYESLLKAYSDENAWLGGDHYERFLAKTALSASDAYALDAVHLTGTAQIALSDRNDVKRAIMSHGAATVQIRFDYGYYNFDTHAYYYSGSNAVNHDVTLVGWDDSYASDNFGSDGSSATRPTGNGAWLVKNSYGSNFGDNGFFWLSYEDSCLNRFSSQVFVFDVDTAKKYDNIYQYDGSAGTCYNRVNSGGSIANVYTAKANPSGAEKIRAVSFSLSDVNVGYSIQIYSDVKRSADPTSGTALLGSPVTGTTTYMGYYTVVLPQPVAVAEGTKYSVVVTLTHKDGTPVAYNVDTTYGAGDRYVDWIHYTNAVQAGQSFERDSEGLAWDDLSSKVYDSGDEPASSARLKVFTSNVSRTSIKGATVSISPKVTYTGSALKPAVTVRLNGVKLRAGADYTVSYKNNKKVGAATVQVSGLGLYNESKTVKFQIAKAANPLRVSGKTALVAFSKKKTRVVKASKAYVFKKKAVGTLTYARVKKGSSKWLPKVNAKTGAISVKAGAPKATYAVKVKVAAKGNGNYKSLSKTVTVKVKVR